MRILFFFLLILKFVDSEPNDLEFKEHFGRFFESFLTDCSLCKIGRDVQKNANLKVLIENKLNEFCKKVPAGYGDLCKILADKSAQRLSDFAEKFAESTNNCEKLCANPSKISGDTLCQMVAQISENFDSQYTTLLSDASEYCKTKSNPVECQQELKQMSPLAKKVAQRFLLQVVNRIDPVKRCNLESASFSKLVRGEGDALPLQCSLCSTLAEFLAQASSVQLFDQILGEAAVSVCKLIQPLLKGFDCSGLQELGQLVNLLFCQLLYQSSNNGGTPLCASLYKGVCPAPPEGEVAPC